MGLIDQVKTAPPWIWITGGIGFLLLIFVATSKGGSTQTVGTPSADINDILKELQDAADQVGGQTPPTTGNPTTPGTPTKPSFWGKDIPSSISSAFTEAQIKPLFTKFKINYGGAVNIIDLQALLKKAGVNYGSSVDAGDITKLLGGTSKPTGVWGKDVPSSIRGAVSESKIKSIFKRYNLNYGGAINMVDLIALFRKAKINYGKTINPVDIKYLIQKSNNQVR